MCLKVIVFETFKKQLRCLELLGQRSIVPFLNLRRTVIAILWKHCIFFKYSIKEIKCTWLVMWSNPLKLERILRGFDHVLTKFIFRWTFQRCCLFLNHTHGLSSQLWLFYNFLTDISTASVKSPLDLWRHHRYRERWIVYFAVLYFVVTRHN